MQESVLQNRFHPTSHIVASEISLIKSSRPFVYLEVIQNHN